MCALKAKEIWLPVKSYEGLYYVSNFGDVKRKDHILKPTITQGSYKISLSKNGVSKSFNIHRIVSNSFIGECPIGKQVNHKDGNRLNNILSNLEYMTSKENHRHATINGLKANGEKNGWSKLTNKQALEIKKKYGTGKYSYSELAKEYKITLQAIFYVVKKGWKI